MFLRKIKNLMDFTELKLNLEDIQWYFDTNTFPYASFFEL